MRTPARLGVGLLVVGLVVELILGRGKLLVGGSGAVPPACCG
jgi:hypothetical protein